MRLQALGDPELMNQLRQTQPQFADVIQNDPKKFREMLADMGRQQAGVEQEKNRQVEVSTLDRDRLTARR
jgi:DNA damage-inducible protein 1